MHRFLGGRACFLELMILLARGLGQPPSISVFIEVEVAMFRKL